MPIRRLSNLPYHYSIYGIQIHCQARRHEPPERTMGFVKNFPDELGNLMV